MTNTQVTEPTENDSAKEFNAEAKKHALIAYCLMGLGLFIGITWLAGAIWAMVKKSDANGSIFETHYSNIIVTFWISLACSLLGLFTIFIIIGYFILIGTVMWSVYRIAKGLARITSDRPY
ncbi:YIP1 family protein [Porticoccaceae bacterium]|nr:YIP1 family protein [Porticoccaceae bacterium]MDA8682271.1 YIP1 family protein [Porticoccaceae bacterium]MDA8788888.1 YIP1 family protein [Porticoccaceae bacterium]MDB2343798.1 YIP1 family protein [Porticoccaceae bacterium]